MADRGFAPLEAEGIPIAGKHVLRSFLLQRSDIATDANLILTQDAEVAVCKVSVEEYLEQIVETRKDFEKVLTAIGLVENISAEAVMTDISKLERELRALLRHCKIQTAARPAQGVGIVGIRAERLKFPRYDGSQNFNIFKEIGRH